MQELNIMFTSVGRRVPLIRQFAESRRELGLTGQIVAVDFKDTAPASAIADHFVQAPRADSPDFIPFLLEVCKKYRIDLLIPLIDPELLPIATNSQAFREIGTTPVISGPETIRIGADKRDTSRFFGSIGVDAPKHLDLEHLMQSKNPCFPILLKPARGSSSLGVTKIHNEKELSFFSDYVEDAILQEFVEGDEYTLDVLADFSGLVKCVVPRLRIETRAGEISKGRTVKNRRIMEAGASVVSQLPDAAGCITLQCFLTPDDEIKFIEINPRFGGGVPLSIEAGADFPRWLLEMYLERDRMVAFDQWQDGLMMLRYDDAIFVKGKTRK